MKKLFLALMLVILALFVLTPAADAQCGSVGFVRQRAFVTDGCGYDAQALFAPAYSIVQPVQAFATIQTYAAPVLAVQARVAFARQRVVQQQVIQRQVIRQRAFVRDY